MTDYFITTPATSPIALRPDHNTQTEALSYIPQSTSVRAIEVWTAPEELKTLSGRVYQMVGDKWAKVTYGNATGYVAVIHRGAVFCHLREDGRTRETAPTLHAVATVTVVVNIDGQLYQGEAYIRDLDLKAK